MWYFWGKNSSIVRVLKKFLGYRALCCLSFVDQLSGQHWRLNQMFNVSYLSGFTSNLRYMVIIVPFEAGGYMILRPKVDRWVDFTQFDYGGLIKNDITLTKISTHGFLRPKEFKFEDGIFKNEMAESKWPTVFFKNNFTLAGKVLMGFRGQGIQIRSWNFQKQNGRL